MTATKAQIPSVLVMRLFEAQTSDGRTYLKGTLGTARVAAFRSKQPSRNGNYFWNVQVSPEGSGPPPADVPRGARYGETQDLPDGRPGDLDEG